VGEDGLHGKGIVDGGDQAQAATIAGTGQGIEIEHAAHQRRPGPGVVGVSLGGPFAQLQSSLLTSLLA
jgi:hypothetical protein